MVGDELDRIDFIPDQPDADTILKGMGEVRIAYLGTSPDVHAVNTPVYKAQILPPDADFPSNGLAGLSSRLAQRRWRSGLRRRFKARFPCTRGRRLLSPPQRRARPWKDRNSLIG